MLGLCHITMEPSPPQAFLLLILLLITSDCRAHPPQTVSASVDEPVLLPCGDNPKNASRLRWMKYSTDAGKYEVLLSWPPHTQDSKRAEWNSDRNGERFLLLKNLDKSDEGLYSCEVCQAWDCTLVTNITLRVKECSFLPALRVKSGTDIELNCSVDTKSQDRPHNVSWSVLKGGRPTPLKSKGAEVKDTALTIPSASFRDSAWYRCSYDNQKNHHCFDVKVHVQDPNEAVTTFAGLWTELKPVQRTKGSFFTLTVVASLITVTLSVAALTGFIIYCRSNASQPPGSQQQSDGDYYEHVSFTQSHGSMKENHLYLMCGE